MNSSVPVLGADLLRLREKFGLSVADACWLFGLTMNKWMDLVRTNPSRPVPDESLDLLARLLDEYPECSPLPTMPTMPEFFGELNTIRKTDKRTFSLLLGREGSSGYRWLTQNSGVPPVITRIAYVITKRLSGKGVEEKEAVLDEWAETVDKIARARLGKKFDVFAEGKWTDG